MADNDKEINKGDVPEETVAVPSSVLADIQKQLAGFERDKAESDAKIAGLEEMIANGAVTNTDATLRKKKDFAPKFHSVKLRQYPIAGDHENLGWVVGWTNRGAYQEVDRSGVSPQMVDYIDIIFLGDEKTKEGKIKAEKVRLLDLLNKGTQTYCKVLKEDRTPRAEPTGEEIDVSIFDPAHGLIQTGEKVDGVVMFSDVVLTIEVPGHPSPVEIDSTFVN